MKSIAIAEITRRIGSSINLGIISFPNFDGTETVVCDLKLAGKNGRIPRKNKPIAITMNNSFDDSGTTPIWNFSISGSQSSFLKPSTYITDSKIVFSNGHIQFLDPILIHMKGTIS